MVTVSLPRGHFQGIKRMMMLTTHGLFLTCTQNSIFIFKQHLINFLGITPYPLALEVQGKLNLLGRPMSSSWWRIPIQSWSWWWIPIHSGPLPGINCPPLTFQSPLTPPPPLAQTILQWRHQQFRSSWSRTTSIWIKPELMEYKACA